MLGSYTWLCAHLTFPLFPCYPGWMVGKSLHAFVPWKRIPLLICHAGIHTLLYNPLFSFSSLNNPSCLWDVLWLFYLECASLPLGKCSPWLLHLLSFLAGFVALGLWESYPHLDFIWFIHSRVMGFGKKSCPGVKLGFTHLSKPSGGSQRSVVVLAIIIFPSLSVSGYLLPLEPSTSVFETKSLHWLGIC